MREADDDETPSFKIADWGVENLLKLLSNKGTCPCCTARALALHAACLAEDALGSGDAAELFERIAERTNHRYATLNEISGQARQSIILVIRPGKFDCHVPTLNIACLAHAFAKRSYVQCLPVGRRAVEESDHRHWLLPARRERIRGRRAAERG
jgi:hypothetical protein